MNVLFSFNTNLFFFKDYKEKNIKKENKINSHIYNIINYILV